MKATEAILESRQIVFCNAKNLLREDLTEKQVFSECAVSAGPFEWLSELQNWIGRWPDLPSEDQDFMLEDSSDAMMFHAGELDCCLEAFDELFENHEESMAGKLNMALQRRLRNYLASRGPTGGASINYAGELSELFANGMVSRLCFFGMLS